MLKRSARVLLAGGIGAVVALLIVMLSRPGATFDAPESAPAGAASSSESRAGSAVAAAAEAGREPVVTSSPTAPGETIVAAPAALAGQRAGAAAANLGAPAARSAPAPIATAAAPAYASEAGSNEREERPARWCFLKTRDDHDYVSDSSTVWSGSRSVWIGKQNDAAADGGYFSSDVLWQGVDATALRGLRIEVSARIKGRGYLQFFVRTATATDSGIVLHDSQLPSVPTTNRHVNLFAPLGVDWGRFSIVADVPVEADVVYYGVTLMGGRAIWIDDVRIATVDRETPLTQEHSIGGRFILPVDARAALLAPANLDFEVTTSEKIGC